MVEEVLDNDIFYTIRRIGKAQEFKNVIVFLASGELSFMTGLTVSVDGGRKVRQFMFWNNFFVIYIPYNSIEILYFYKIALKYFIFI